MKRMVTCRYCGGSWVYPHSNQWGMCHDCYCNCMSPDTEGCLPTDQTVAAYLASKVARMARRVARGDPVSRCCALAWGGPEGRQCLNFACGTRDGRPTCLHHLSVPAPVFFDSAVAQRSDDEIFADLLVLALNNKPAAATLVADKLQGLIDASY